MQKLKYTLRKVDIFGVPFSFKYKDEGSFTTPLGGVIFLIYCIICLIVGIYYFIPFYNRQIFTIIYYSMNMDDTEQIKLAESKAAFAIGLNCGIDEDGTKAEDLLKLEAKFYTQTKTREGKTIKTGGGISTHNCNYADFYNSYNKSLDLISINNYQCLDDKNNIIQGIYTDEAFSYYSFTISSKIDSKENYDKINNYLTRNDCKLQFYYTDIIIDLYDYEEPIKYYLNTFFIQLDPTSFMKANVFFMNQYFENDNYLIFNFEEGKSEIKTLFSRTEEYALYKGLDRGEAKPEDYQKFASIYIRAETKKTEIKRKYQKLTEFYADASSLLITLFDVLSIIFSYIYTFYAEHTLIKKLFLFKDVENKNFDLLKNTKKIKTIINSTEAIIDKNPPKETSMNNKTKNIEKENDENNIYSRRRIYFTIEDTDKEKYTKNNNYIGKNNNNNKIADTGIFRKNKKKRYNSMITRNSNVNEIDSNIPTTQVKEKLNARYSGKRMSFKSNNKFTEIEEETNPKINFSYNIFEVIVSSFCCSCMTQNLRIKKNITLKANTFLYNKLDIFLYVKNQFLIDYMKLTLLDANTENKKSLIDFLSRPIISIKKEEKEKIKIHKCFTEDDFDKFYNEIMEMIKNPKPIINEKDFIISFSNKKLKELI